MFGFLRGLWKAVTHPIMAMKYFFHFLVDPAQPRVPFKPKNDEAKLATLSRHLAARLFTVFPDAAQDWIKLAAKHGAVIYDRHLGTPPAESNRKFVKIHRNDGPLPYAIYQYACGLNNGGNLLDTIWNRSWNATFLASVGMPVLAGSHSDNQMGEQGPLNQLWDEGFALYKPVLITPDDPFNEALQAVGIEVFTSDGELKECLTHGPLGGATVWAAPKNDPEIAASDPSAKSKNPIVEVATSDFAASDGLAPDDSAPDDGGADAGDGD